MGKELARIGLRGVLRGAGSIAAIDPATGEVLRRTPVCAAPRGVAFDPAWNAVHVACAEGLLVTLDAATHGIVRRRWIDVDLRDVVVRGNLLLVSRFRAAEILSLDAEGEILDRWTPADVEERMPGEDYVEGTYRPAIAWRMRGTPAGVVLMHQRALTGPTPVTASGGSAYGADCFSILHGAATPVGVGPSGELSPLVAGWKESLVVAALLVDVAVRGTSVAAVSAGARHVYQSFDEYDQYGDSTLNARACGDHFRWGGMPTSVEYAGAELLVQLRDPPAIARVSDKTSLELPTDGLRDVEDTGFDLFHISPDGVVACASCHPEGQEDGRVWDFADVGLRRTQSLRGGITSTAPFHWDGEMADLRAIMTEVFTHRMGGEEQSEAHVDAISRWIDALPPLPPLSSPRDKAAAFRGKAIFHDPNVGCASCHSGASFTSNTNASVGKGRPPLQTPSLLGVAWRAPFMHDGCAKALADRFDPACGGDQHGDVSALSDADLGALVAYLETL